MRKNIATGTLAGALVVAGVMGASLFLGTPSANAQDPAASGAPTASAAPFGGSDGCGGRGIDFGGDGFGHNAAIAKAIGITETDLQAALASGKTIAAVATEKGVAVQTVIDAYVADENAEIDAAVKAGTLTQAQADAAKANVAQRGADIVNGTGRGPGGPGGRGMDFGGDGFGHNAAIAKAIGITEADLQAALASGKTIAAVATEKGVAVQTVIDAYVADETAEIDAAVKAGTLTQAQADAAKANVAQRGADIVNGTGHGPGGPGGFGGGRGGRGGHGAPGTTTPTPDASPSTTTN